MKPQAPADFYQSLFENTLDGLAYCQMIFDAHERPVDFMYVEVNKNFEILTGLKNAAGKKVTALIPGIAESNPELFEIYGRVSLTGTPERFETYVEPLLRWFLVSVYSPQKKFFVAVFQNITERKQIEKDFESAKIAARNVLEDLEAEKEKLTKAKAKDEAMLASIGDGLVITDMEGKIVLTNKIFEKLLGWKESEVTGKLFTEIIPATDENEKPIPTAERQSTKALASSIKTTTTTTTYKYQQKGGAFLPVAVTVAPIFVGEEVIGIVEVFRDISREKAIDKTKTEFVSLASHQLRTPLTAISWYTEMILKGDVGKVIPGQKKYLEEIYGGNQRMIELVNTLLNVSRLELGTLQVEAKPTDIIKLAESVLDEQKPKIETKKLVIVRKFSKDVPIFSADPKLLRMVLQNLMANAVEYTPPGGRIEFAISLESQTILIKISDTGYGIPKKQQDQIFTKLFRADNARDKDTDGTGLGLYIVKSIVENSGGKVWFESEENKGTVFYVTLPLDGMKKSAEGGSASGGKETN